MLKQMSAGEILDNTFPLFKEQFKSYLAIAALGIVPFAGFALILYILFGATIMFWIGLVITVLSVIVVSLAMTGGLFKKASDQFLGQEISIIDAYRFGFRKALYLFLGSLVYVVFFGIYIGIYFILLMVAIYFPGILLYCIITLSLLIIPVIYFAVRLVFLFHAIIIEDKDPLIAVKRSMDLTKGYWWRTFCFIFLANFLFNILSSTIALFIVVPPCLMSIFLFGPEIGNVIGNTLSIIISFLFIPFSVIAITLYYYDIRIRKENLDLKLMVEHLTASSTAGWWWGKVGL